ncbi:MAG: hypothetical protein ACHQ9S_18900 [Candidatus Binatia bacterium]
MKLLLTKQWWMDLAEVVDALRIFPRFMVTGYGLWVGWFTDWFVAWYEKLPAVERTNEVTLVFGIVIPAVCGLATWVFKMYLDGGRKWDQQKDQQT